MSLLARMYGVSASQLETDERSSFDFAH